MKGKYEELLRLYKEALIIEEILMLLYWDRDVTMPKGGVKQKSEQVAYLSKLGHEKRVNPKIGELLKEIQDHSDFDELTELEKRNVFLINREYYKIINVPSEFVGEFNKQCVIASDAWEKAKNKSDYTIFLPELKKMLEFNRKYAHFLNPNIDPYDALIDYSEPGMTQTKFEVIVNPLKEATVQLLRKCMEAEKQPDLSILTRKVPIEIQKKLNMDALKLIEYDLNRGRLDETVHPFTTGTYDDVRITTRYFEDNVLSALMSTLHEAGHGTYEQNVGKNGRYQPVGMWCSDGVHEGCARFYENILGRSFPFWNFYFPKLLEITEDIFSDVPLEDFVFAINSTRPTAVRVEADELTYNLHIILRFEIERDLINRRLEAEDIPQVWNKKMKELLDYEVQNDAEGVLQDIHWSDGLMGYFPTYTLGNIFGAQIFFQMKKEIPDWEQEIEKGNLKAVLNWFKTNVHERGNTKDSLEMVKEITGKEVTADYLIEYLQEKYSKLYNLD